MKKITLVVLAAIGIHTAAIAQTNETAIKNAVAGVPTEVKTDTSSKHWKFGGGATANFGQVALVNWAAGGQNSISVLLQGAGFANYRKGKINWDNSATLDWGIIAQGKLKDLKNNRYPVRKNVDLLTITSKFGYAIDKKNHWLATALLDFKTGITNGWDYSAYDADKISPRQRVSKFAAPAFLTTSVGVMWRPVPYFSAYLSPIAGKFTFVTRDVPGAVSTTDIDERRYGLDLGKVWRPELGAYFRADFQKDIWKNINLKTSVELFENYIEKKKLDVLVQNEIDEVVAAGGTPSAVVYPDGKVVNLYNKQYYDNRKNIDVNWMTMLTLSVNKFLKASIATQLIYDHDQIVPKFDKSGNAYQGRGTQFREAFTLGLGYVF